MSLRISSLILAGAVKCESGIQPPPEDLQKLMKAPSACKKGSDGLPDPEACSIFKNFEECMACHICGWSGSKLGCNSICNLGCGWMQNEEVCTDCKCSWDEGQQIKCQKPKECCVVLKTGECFDGFFCNLSPDTCNMCASTTHWDKQKKQGDRCEDPTNTKMGDEHCQTDSKACQKCGLAAPVALWETPKPKDPNCCVSLKTGQCMEKQECNLSENNCTSCSSTTHWLKGSKEDKKCLAEDDKPIKDDNCQMNWNNCQKCGLVSPRGMWSTPAPHTPVKPTPTALTTPSPTPSKEEQIVLV